MKIILLFFLLLSSFLHLKIESGILLGIKLHGTSIHRKNDILVVATDIPIKITLYGTNIQEIPTAFLTKMEFSENSQCLPNQSVSSKVELKSYEENSLEMKTVIAEEGLLFFCLFSNGNWIHQGDEDLLSLKAFKPFFTISNWLLIIIILILLCCSALLSGQNLSLMIFQPSTLQSIIKSGSKRERLFAKRIYPVRKLGNILLCSILLSNVLVNTTITIMVEKLTKSYIITLCITTFGIVIFGEIFPQAFGSRYALALSAQTIWFTIICLILTFIIAYPIGKILNLILGKEIRQYYSKDKLKILIKEQEKLGYVMKDEMEIISGALALNEKTVIDVMTPISNAYMINYNANLDFNTMCEIVRNGYTRIPVYDKDKNDIRGILNIKDLTFIDPQDNIPVSTICTFYNRQILIVPATTKLPELLDEFKQGKAHLAFVEKLITHEDADPYQTLVGLITLEDVIEEIIQAEIVDETDVFSDNTLRRTLLHQNRKSGNFKASAQQFKMSPQLFEATFQYLVTKISSFKETYIKKHVLSSLLSSNILLYHTHKEDKLTGNQLISAGSPIISAILIIQGKVSVRTESENLVFEGGPFMIFGESIFKNINNYLKKNSAFIQIVFDTHVIYKNCKSIPDYTVSSLTDIQYVCISASQYFLARNLSKYMSEKEFNRFTSKDWNDLGEVRDV